MLDVYRTYYRMTGEPFRLSPDHRFSLAHSSYANAKAYLQYAIFQGEGFIAVTGGPGTGKTTLISDLIEGLDKEHIEVATLTSTQLESRDLLQMVVNLFDLRPEDKTKPGLLQELEHFLNQQSYKGRRVILIVDEAQGLSTGALEELRLLANLQRNHQLLLQVFLVGQEQLLEMLRAPGMEHLHQRLIAASHLQPLSLDEVIDYIEHRLSRVGWKGDPSIDEGALRLIHQYSGGVPRRINLICNRLFLYGGLEQKHDLVAADARLVIDELHKEFLLSADADSVNSQEAAAEPDTGADTPVRRLPRRDMNAAPEQAADEAASPQEPRKTRRKPEKAKPRKAARPPGRKRNSPEQVTPSQVSGRKRRIEPTMRRDPTIGAARPAPAPEPVAKKRSWGKVAFVVLLIGFFYAAYYGDDEFNKLLGLLENSDEAKPQVTFSKPLDTTVTTEEPVPVEEPAPVPETVGVTAEQAETGGDGLPVETVADTDEVEADEAEVSSDTPSPAVMAETPAVSEDSLPEEEPPAEPLAMQEETAVPEPGNTAEPDNSTAVAEAEPPQPAEVVEPEPVKVDAASVEAEKARLRREAELRLAMNLNQDRAGVQATVPVPVKAPPVPKKKLAPAPVNPEPDPPVKVATAPKIKAAPQRSPLAQLKAALLEGQWSSRGKPASLLPSKVTYCNSQGERIACLSVPQDIKTKYGPALYKVETTLKGFSEGKRFQLSYRTLVKLLKDDSDSVREAALAVDSGWQISEYSMSCRLARPDQVLCRDDKGVTRDYRRSVTN